MPRRLPILPRSGAWPRGAALALAVLAAFLCYVAGSFPGASSLFGGAAPVAAQEIDNARLRSAKFETATGVRGGKAILRIEFDIDPGYHMYPQSSSAQAPTFTWNEPEFLVPGAIVELSKPHEIEAFGAKELAFDKELILQQEFTVAADAPLGVVELKGKAQWQYCNDQNCFQPRGPVRAKLEIVEVVADGAGGAGGTGGAGGAANGGAANGGAANGGGVVAAPQNADPNQLAPKAPEPKQPEPRQPAPARDTTTASTNAPTLGELLLKAIVAGLLTVLTPCVFPLLPVTVSFFSKQKGAALPRSVVYALGIIFTITVIGLVFSSTIGAFARGWVFNAVVGVLFIILSLSLFGLFDLRMPSFLLDWSSAKAGGGGLIGAFFMAVTLALTSFSCSMPFLAVMFEDFARGDRVMAVTGLVAYSGTLAAPFFLCSLFPSALQSLPRAGEWMNAVKVVMGFVEFGLAFKFLRTVALNFESDVLPRSLVLSIWAACAFGAAIYLLGFIVLPHDTKVESIGVFRLVFALAFLASGLYITPGIYRKQLANWIESFIQTNLEHDIDGFVPIPWVLNDWEGSHARAAEKKRPILFDFTGDG